MDLEVPVVCAASLNRGVEQRMDKRPTLGDLRESGQLESDADVVAFLYRDELYNQTSDAKGEAEFIIAKQRNGPTGVARLAFIGRYLRFADLAHPSDSFIP
jgi:replicative DNA helicase